MARTINGNLTGKAASIERSEQLEQMYSLSPFTINFRKAEDELIKLMGFDNFATWYDQPKFDGLKNRDMLLLMNLKIDELQAEQNTFVDLVEFAEMCDEHAVVAAQKIEQGIDWKLSAEQEHADWLDNNRTMEDARF